MIASDLMKGSLFSIRMHATREGEHLSGAERIGCREELEGLAATLLQRALDHERGEAEQVRLTVERVDPDRVHTGRLPDLTTVTVTDYEQGRRAARHYLREAGVTQGATEMALQALAAGASPDGSNMRGAMLVDAENGERLEPDPCRGVRASRMDLTAGARSALEKQLAPQGLANTHVCEALVLAAKVLAAPGVVAELCWSDDPSYVAGYVASREQGYVRFPHMKPLGDGRGGRAFFLDRRGLDIEQTITYLEKAVLLVTETGLIRDPITWED